MEKFELVDINGIKTGKIVTLEELETKDSSEIFPEGCYLPVAGIVVINENDEILLEKRSIEKSRGAGKWGICAGKVDFDETTIEAAIRETFEEIGVKFKENELRPLSTDLIKNGRYTIYYVRTNLKESQYMLQKGEVDEVRYFKIDELENLENSLFDWLDNVKGVLFNI